MVSILAENIQSIKQAQLVMDETGIVEFVGDNSNGKSIIIKTLGYILNGDAKSESIRKDLINDSADCGKIGIAYRSKMLIIMLHRVLSQCYVQYVSDINRMQETTVTRQLNDSGVDKLFDKFGFRIYAGGSIVLQIAQTMGEIPFVTTPTKVNGEIVKSICTDAQAEEFIDIASRVTYPAFKNAIAARNAELNTLNQSMTGIKMYDVEEYQSMSDELGKIIDSLKGLDYVSIEPFDLIDVNLPDLPMVKFEPFYVIPEPPSPVVITDAINTLKAMEQLRAGICPTCGRPMLENI